MDGTMGALLWYMHHGSLGARACASLDDAAQTQAGIDDEWSCEGVEAFHSDGRREWLAFDLRGPENAFVRRVREIQDERRRRYAEGQQERPVREVVTIAPPSELDAPPSIEGVEVVYLRDGDDRAARIKAWEVAVGADRVSVRPPR